MLLLFASVLFLVARAAVPEASSDQPIDLTTLYARDRRKIMTLFLLFSLCGTVVNLTLPGFATSELFAIALAMMALFVIAWRWPDHRVQLTVVAFHFVLMGYYAFRYEPLL